MPTVLSVTTDAALVVDLDDTLVRTDLLLEQLLKAVKANPWRLPAVAALLFGSRVELKQRLAKMVTIDPATLPYRQTVLDRIAKERSAGRRVLLASASHERVVRAVHDHLGLFDDYLATVDRNLKGKAKAEVIAERLGGRPFVYIGDAAADLPIWEQSQGAIAVNPSPSVERRLARLGRPFEVLRDSESRLRLVLKQMRVHQWVKNLLVLVPVIAGHKFFQLPLLMASLLAFVAFSLCASTVYVLNDLLDVEADRAHRTKCRRPFASGALSLRVGFVLCPALLLGALAAAAPLPAEVWALLAVYLVLNMAYSFKLKELIITDTVVLAGFYTLRILVGSAASTVPASYWLLAFSLFFFFGLALVKRYTELDRSREKGALSGRGYCREDRLPVFVMGAASSFIAVLILVLYLNGNDVQRLYAHWERLWLVTPITLYWTARVWLLAHRGEINDDPVVFAIKDPVSWVAIGLLGLIFGAAIL